jgi:hypothetical protein
MAEHDETVEKVARAIYAASPTVWHESVEPTTMVSPAYQRVTRPIPWNELLENAKSVSHEASAVNEIRSLARAAVAAMPPALSTELIGKLNALASRLTEQGEYDACDLIDTVVERLTPSPGAKP